MYQTGSQAPTAIGRTMKRFFREYGLVVVLIALGMVGYAIFRENKLDGSLSEIRARLVEMIDESSREAVARHFDRFQEKVLAHEVPPEEVENIAANVLNLSNSGSTLTPEQATLMLDMASSAVEVTLLPSPADTDATPPLAAVAPRPPAPPPPVEPVALDALGERLESMLDFDGEVRRVMDARRVDRRELARHVRYRFDEGLHIDIDVDMDEAMKQQLAQQVEQLEKRKMIVWKQNMDEEMRAERARARRDLRTVTALRRRPPPDARVAVQHLEALKHLETLGYRALISDSVRHEINVQLEGALAALEKDLRATMAEQEGDVDEQMETLEEFLEEVEDAMEAFEEAMEEAAEEVEEAVEEAEEAAQEALEEAAEEDDDDDT